MSAPNTDVEPMLKDQAADKKSHGFFGKIKKPSSPKKRNQDIEHEFKTANNNNNKQTNNISRQNSNMVGNQQMNGGSNKGHNKNSKQTEKGKKKNNSSDSNIFAKLSKMGRIFKSSKNNDATSAANKEITDKLKQEQQQSQRSLRILLLGAGGSGKTTVFKQMEKLYNGDIERKALVAAKEDIYRNILIDVYDLCKYNIKLNSTATNDLYRLSSGELIDICHRISTWPSHFILEDPAARLTRSVAIDIDKLWKDEAMKNTWLHRKNFHIMDNTPYFFEKILDIKSSKEEEEKHGEWQATFDDFVRVRDQTTGIVVKHFRAQTEFGEYKFEVTDVGGQRAERRKWMRLFDNISVVVYIMSLSAYDQHLYEDNTKNCWDETLELFSKTSHESVFDSTDWVIFFNKVDLFEKKIKEIPFTVYQPNFNDLHMHDPLKVKEYIRDQFTHRFYDGLSKERRKRRGNLYFHVTCATKSEDVGRIIQKVQIDLIKSQMKKMGYLL